MKQKAVASMLHLSRSLLLLIRPPTGSVLSPGVNGVKHPLQRCYRQCGRIHLAITYANRTPTTAPSTAVPEASRVSLRLPLIQILPKMPPSPSGLAPWLRPPTSYGRAMPLVTNRHDLAPSYRNLIALAASIAGQEPAPAA